MDGAFHPPTGKVTGDPRRAKSISTERRWPTRWFKVQTKGPGAKRPKIQSISTMLRGRWAKVSGNLVSCDFARTERTSSFWLESVAKAKFLLPTLFVHLCVGIPLCRSFDYDFRLPSETNSIEKYFLIGISFMNSVKAQKAQHRCFCVKNMFFCLPAVIITATRILMFFERRWCECSSYPLLTTESRHKATSVCRLSR